MLQVGVSERDESATTLEIGAWRARSTRDAARSVLQTPAGVTTTVILGVDRDDVHDIHTHGAKIWEATSGCPPSTSWVVDDVGSAWNDRISSAKACNRHEHYENVTRGGASLACLPNCYEMGVMNDQTSSLWLKYS